MKLETSNKDFLNVLEVSSKLLDEVKLECDNDGLRFSGLDKSHICFYNADFDKSYFDSYECPVPESLFIDTMELVKVLKRMKSDDRLLLVNDAYNLTVIFEGEATRTFNVRLIDGDYTSPSMPHLEPPNQDVMVDFNEFIIALKDTSLYSDKVSLSMSGDEFLVSCDGEYGSYESKIIVPCNTQDARSVFSLDFLNRFIGLGKLSSTVYIGLGDDMPLILLVQDLMESVKVQVLLAPRIESDY